MNRTIQHSVFPTMDLCSETKMFFKQNSKATINLNTAELFLLQGAKVDTATYFNSVSVGKWKKNTNIDDLNLSIRFKGHIKITFKLSILGSGTLTLHEEDLSSLDYTQQDIALPFWSKITNGMLFFEVYALEDSYLSSFYYYTQTPIKTKAKLGIVITHFNRQDYILPAIARLKQLLLGDAEYGHKVDLIIVDNSQNLPAIDGVTIIKNENLGGAGGFTRGLIYLKDHPQYTHCLFMDDDASCDTESIKRTIALLESTDNVKLAISGAMLTESEVYRQYECGAYFNGTCKSVDKGLNMLYEYDLLKNERPKRIDYGAWWFFAFNLKGVDHNAFPYFVRGDDISFSYGNHFDVQTMNGICSWQSDFGAKSNPLSIYLDVRNHLMHPLHGFVKGNVLWSMIRSASLIFGYQVIGYHYDSAKAAIIAIDDVLKGPDFWRQNVDMVMKRKQIQNIITTEKPIDIPPLIYQEGIMAHVETNTSVDIEDKTTTKLTKGKILRYITLNGHLIPMVFFKKGFVWVRKSLGSRMSTVFRYRKAIFIIDGADQCVVLYHDKKKFFAYSMQFATRLMRLTWNYKQLKREYMASYPELTSDEFWRQQFNLEKSREND